MQCHSGMCLGILVPVKENDSAIAYKNFLHNFVEKKEVSTKYTHVMVKGAHPRLYVVYCT